MAQDNESTYYAVMQSADGVNWEPDPGHFIASLADCQKYMSVISKDGDDANNGGQIVFKACPVVIC
jgi:hypothetical protein